jgi:ABC-2 type transport system permease protein
VSIKRYASLYAALWRNSIVREMGFKTNFLLWIVVELLWFALQISFIVVIYSHTDRIGIGRSGRWCCWSARAISFSNCSPRCSEQLRADLRIHPHRQTGFHAPAAVNTRFIVSLRQVDLGGFINATSARP